MKLGTILLIVLCVIVGLCVGIPLIGWFRKEKEREFLQQRAWLEKKLEVVDDSNASAGNGKIVELGSFSGRKRR